MNRRRHDARLRGLTRAGLTMLLVATGVSYAEAAVTTFRYSTRVEETYDGDVFRFGVNRDPQSDYITSFGIRASLSSSTPRSELRVDYTPEYLMYYEFDDLNSLNHRLRGTWDVTPRSNSNAGVRVGYSRTNQQTGFQSFSGVGGNPAEPILQLTERVTWDVEPYFRLRAGRGWAMETTAIYRSQNLSDPTLVDSATAALTLGANTRVGRMRRLGGVIRYGRNFYQRNITIASAGQPRDEVLNLEATYAQQEGEVFRWRTGLGFFRVLDNTARSSGAPTLRLGGSWNLERSTIQAGYDLSFSTVTGAVGTARSERTNIEFARRWGRGFTGGANVQYVRFRNLVTNPLTRYLDGFSTEVEAAYRWPSHWGLTFRVTHLIQEQTSGRSLDFFQASVALSFTP